MDEEDLSWMIKQAEEELQILEAQHPNRFGYLKMELRSFIHGETEKPSPPYFPKSFVSYRDGYYSSMSNSSATTQASSNRKRKVSEIQNQEANPESTNRNFPRLNQWMERVDAAIERAEACLQKIQEIKRSFADD
ncbi:hypothetical protein NE237_008212 [Protea cynaroides]|uniref:Uncharacterized protein n=1 Tax=Protea cynaroides TaxID=273540 RepID=A0A9Q0KQM0_9MAGN|nr:hypothetical protein NE237_008212 [Protea cynaroides]